MARPPSIRVDRAGIRRHVFGSGQPVDVLMKRFAEFTIEEARLTAPTHQPGDGGEGTYGGPSIASELKLTGGNSIYFVRAHGQKAEAVLRGTPPHLIPLNRRTKGQKRLKFFWKKKGIIVRPAQVSHPGININPRDGNAGLSDFLNEALDTTKRRFFG